MPPVNHCTLMLAPENQLYALPLPEIWQDVNIAYIEMTNIWVTLKVWHVQWAGLKVSIKCETVVSALFTGKISDKVMAKYTRNVFPWLSAFNTDIQVVYIPGKMNPVADLLSRSHKTVSMFQNCRHWSTLSYGSTLLRIYFILVTLFDLLF